MITKEEVAPIEPTGFVILLSYDLRMIDHRDFQKF